MNTIPTPAATNAAEPVPTGTRRVRLRMAGLDHKTAGIETRERFALPPESCPAALQRLQRDAHLAGCAVISTCNRSELYLSCDNGSEPDPAFLFCQLLDLSPENASSLYRRDGGSAVRHLMRVAGGLESSVPGDDQIVAQVRTAIELARKAGTADAQLETLFRLSITAGKKIRTNVRSSRDGNSVALTAIDAITTHFGDLSGKHALVIGNGLIGRMCAAALARLGCRVGVTLRQYRQGRPEIPPGCEIVRFEDRLQAMNTCDFVISATASPHFTVTLDDVRRLSRVPGLMVDLAIPRDIEAAIAHLSGTVLWNVDSFSCDDGRERRILEAEEIIDEEAGKFEIWRQSRRLRRNESGVPDFPVFINLHGSTVLLAGGGKVAARRCEVLLNAGAKVRLVSPELGAGMQKLRHSEGLQWLPRVYETADLEGVTLAVAATSDRDANQRIGTEAREHGVLVSVADKREECTFYFPAIIKSSNLTAGLISANGKHHLVKKAAARLRKELETIDEEYSDRLPGK